MYYLAGYLKTYRTKIAVLSHEKDQKPSEPENPPRKEQGKEKQNELGEREKKMAALLAVMLTSLEIVFERENCLMGEFCFGCNLLKNPTRNRPEIYFSYSCS